jgi:hypothetical protein
LKNDPAMGCFIAGALFLLLFFGQSKKVKKTISKAEGFVREVIAFLSAKGETRF